MALTKLSIIADAGCTTGFSTVTHNIAGYLQDTGEYDISILGINYHGEPNKWSKKFNIWPADYGGGDFLGVAFSKTFIEITKPQVLFLFQDVWNLPYYISKVTPNSPGLVAYYPVDSPNLKSEYMLALAGCCKIACYTQFGVEESVKAARIAWDNTKIQAKEQKMHVLDSLVTNFGGQTNSIGMNMPDIKFVTPGKALKHLGKRHAYQVIPHGVDREAFMELDKATAKEHIKVPKECFVVGNVGTNQSRKRIDLTIKMFSHFAKDKPDVRLVLHCRGTRGWDLRQLAGYYGVADKVIYTHERWVSGDGASMDDMLLLYNSFDVHVNTSGGEGWGLPTMESAACGVPQLVPNWSATAEIWKDAALLININGVRHELSGINTAQCNIDEHHGAELLQQLYEDKNYRLQVAQRCFDVSQRPEYNWENVGKQFHALFKAAENTHPPTGKVALDAQGVLELKKEGIIK